MNVLLFPELTPALMSLSKEIGQVWAPSNRAPPTAKEMAQWREVYLQITQHKVKTLFDRLASLEKEQNNTLKELQRALSIQTQAECKLRSSRLYDSDCRPPAQ